MASMAAAASSAAQRVSEGNSSGGHLLDREAQHGGGGGGSAKGGGERGLHLISCSHGGGHGDGRGDAHAGGARGGHADRDERLVDGRGFDNLLLQFRLVVVREVADAAAGRQREHDRPHRAMVVVARATVVVARATA
eukprot:scaffold51202_cov65-Phaeocystis_antarctica.AAC.10